ncbi:MAG TPA: undecaprenyl-phosphate galactose phosphotransferase WbaP [Anaerolineaceae bacterium]|jgi:Undecaprenyl-phosphate galactose phosphotransferase WbaP
MTHLKAMPKDIFRGRQVLVVLLLVAVDVVSIGLGFQLAVEARRFMIRWLGGTIPPDSFFPLLLQGWVIFIAVFAINGLYPGFGRTSVEETQQIFYSLTLGYGLLALAIYFQQASLELSRWTFALGWAFGCLFNMVLRFAARNRFSLYEWWGTPVLVVGPVERAREVIRNLQSSRRLGLRPVLVLDKSCTTEAAAVHQVPVVSTQSAVEAVLAQAHIHYAFFVGQDIQDPVLRWLGERFSSVFVVLDFSPLGSLWVKTMDLEGRLTLKTQYHLLDRKATITKRAFDLIGGFLMGILSLPLMAILALLIRLDSPGPVIYPQERMGRGGKVFRCFKFRSMRQGAEELLDDLLASDPAAREEYQTYHKLAADPRITRVGRLLRKYSLDELPQVWNILTGDLSLVGPRAYMVSECASMGEYASLILRIPPGLTGWWQVMGRHSTTFEERLRLDEYYLSNWSLWLDVFVIVKTVWILISGKGV